MSKTGKKGRCPQCCPDGGAYHEATYDDEMRPVWKCNNCGFEQRRIYHKRLEEDDPLTPSQIRAITQIQTAKLYDGQEVKTQIQTAKLYDGQEVKQFRLRSLGSFVSVFVEVGRKGDEGTMAAILCRYRGQFFVYRQGRIEAVDPPKGNKTNAKQHPLIYGWRT